MFQILKLCCLLLGVLAFIALIVADAYRFHTDCRSRGGEMVRGAIGWACVAGPS